MDYTRSVGGAALGARLRRLSEAIDRDATHIYAALDIEFEQRWFGIMNQLATNDTATVGQIASSLGITHVSVSQARQSLEKAGLVCAGADPADGRRSRLALTAKGRALAERLAPLWLAMAEASADLDHEAGAVVEKLDQLETALKRQTLLDRVMARLSASSTK